MSSIKTQYPIGLRVSAEQLAVIKELGAGRTNSAILLEALEEWCERRGKPLPKVELTPPGKRPGAGRKKKPRPPSS